MHSVNNLILGATVAAAQFVPPPEPVLLTAAKSGVLPVPPAGFTGIPTLQGAIINKAAANASNVGLLGPAVAQSNLPAATYRATLPPTAFNELTGTIISGTLTGSATQGGSGVDFTLSLANLPDIGAYGPFVYHLHDVPVPADGNCTSTMGHFDALNVGEYYTCDPALAQNCQTGDLAGKHGKITNAPTFSTSFNEPYVSTDPSSPYFFGAKSLTIHTSNTTRLTCANFVLVAEDSSSSSSGGSPNATSTDEPAASPSPLYSSSASKTMMGSALVGMVAVAGVFLL